MIPGFIAHASPFDLTTGGWPVCFRLLEHHRTLIDLPKLQDLVEFSSSHLFRRETTAVYIRERIAGHLSRSKYISNAVQDTGPVSRTVTSHKRELRSFCIGQVPIVNSRSTYCSPRSASRYFPRSTRSTNPFASSFVNRRLTSSRLWPVLYATMAGVRTRDDE